jgi:hypothetical protein
MVLRFGYEEIESAKDRMPSKRTLNRSFHGDNRPLSLLPNSRFLVNTEMMFHYRLSVVRCGTLRRFQLFGCHLHYEVTTTKMSPCRQTL